MVQDTQIPLPTQNLLGQINATSGGGDNFGAFGGPQKNDSMKVRLQVGKHILLKRNNLVQDDFNANSVEDSCGASAADSRGKQSDSLLQKGGNVRIRQLKDMRRQNLMQELEFVEHIV